MGQSLALRMATWGARRFVRPMLAKTGTAEKADASFARAAKVMFRTPPFMCHLTETVAGRTVHWISVGAARPRKIILYFHGGAYLSGSGATHRGMLGRIAKLSGVRVCAPDYRLLQEAPFPAAFDDAVAGWDMLIARGYDPRDIILGGDSAGGRVDAGAFGVCDRAWGGPCGRVYFLALDGFDIIGRYDRL
uniref:alpha/beta hydrolase n=1 Tax=Yoonia sp. TaxID=2212373 RepID=UPI00404891CF